LKRWRSLGLTSDSTIKPELLNQLLVADFLCGLSDEFTNLRIPLASSRLGIIVPSPIDDAFLSPRLDDRLNGGGHHANPA
jgi:hypothetical protein